MPRQFHHRLRRDYHLERKGQPKAYSMEPPRRQPRSPVRRVHRRYSFTTVRMTTKTDLVPYYCRLRRNQLEAINRLATHEIKAAEHFRRAVDMYLSQPAIMEALVELQKPTGR